jgi:hypothetical protein
VDMSLEGIVSEFADQEQHRNDQDPNRRERATTLSYRSQPQGLSQVLDAAATDPHIDVSLSILTRCMSHQLVPWLRSLAGAKDVVSYYTVLCKKSDGFPTIYDKLKNGSWGFSFVHPAAPIGESMVGSWGTIMWAKTEVTTLSAIYGVEAAKLFAVGLCWSLSTNGLLLSPTTIRTCVLPEIDNLRQHIKERMIWLDAFDRIIDCRLEHQANTHYPEPQ